MKRRSLVELRNTTRHEAVRHPAPASLSPRNGTLPPPSPLSPTPGQHRNPEGDQASRRSQ